MKLVKVTKVMEEILLEYSVCYYYQGHKFLYPDGIDIDRSWFKVRTISNSAFDTFEEEYIELCKIVGCEPMPFLFCSMSPSEEFIADKIIEMSVPISNIKLWPKGFDVGDLNTLLEKNEKVLQKSTLAGKILA